MQAYQQKTEKFFVSEEKKFGATEWVPGNLGMLFFKIQILLLLVRKAYLIPGNPVLSGIV